MNFLQPVAKVVETWFTKSRLSSVIGLEASKVRLRAFPIIFRAAEQGLSFRAMLGRLQDAGRVTGLRHTYSRGAMQDDYRDVSRNTGIVDVLKGKPSDYRASFWEIGIGNPAQQQVYMHVVRVDVQDSWTGEAREVYRNFEDDVIHTLDELNEIHDLPYYFWGIEEWEVEVGRSMEAIYKKRGVTITL